MLDIGRPTFHIGDINTDGIVNSIDYGLMNANWASYEAYGLVDVYCGDHKAFTLVVNIILHIFNGITVSNAKEQTVTAREAAKVSRTALCQSVEIGMDVNNISEITVLKAFVSPLKPEERDEFKTKLAQQDAFLKRFHVEYDYPPHIGE